MVLTGAVAAMAFNARKGSYNEEENMSLPSRWIVACLALALACAASADDTATTRVAKEAAFLAANGKKPGVVTTPSGLQYKVIKAGSGPMPAASDLVRVHYHGTLVGGRVFDSSVERGQAASFALNQVIKGWTEGLQTMREGGKTMFYIPPDLAYGERATDTIPANATLIFEVELLKVHQLEMPATAAAARQWRIARMDCGQAPALPPAGQVPSKGLHAQADEYLACAHAYYQLTAAQLQGLANIAGGRGDLAEAAMASLQRGKQDMDAQLAPAVRLIEAYRALPDPR